MNMSLQSQFTYATRNDGVVCWVQKSDIDMDTVFYREPQPSPLSLEELDEFALLHPKGLALSAQVWNEFCNENGIVDYDEEPEEEVLGNLDLHHKIHQLKSSDFHLATGVDVGVDSWSRVVSSPD